MFEMPSPYRRPSSTNALGWKPGTVRSHGSRPEYEVSMWPLNMSDGPPPEPTHVPSAFARLSSTCWRCTCSPMPSKIASISSAIRSSSPVKLCTFTSWLAVSTRRSRSIFMARSPDVRQNLLAEEPDLLVAIGVPQLQHDVRAPCVLVLL